MTTFKLVIEGTIEVDGEWATDTCLGDLAAIVLGTPRLVDDRVKFTGASVVRQEVSKSAE